MFCLCVLVRSCVCVKLDGFSSVCAGSVYVHCMLQSISTCVCWGRGEGGISGGEGGLLPYMDRDI